MADDEAGEAGVEIAPGKPADPGLVAIAYKAMAESVEKTSDRRMQTNNFFIALNGAIAGFDAYVIKEDHRELLVVGVVVGAAACILWAVTLAYYRQLAQAKFRVLGEFETARGIIGYQREWEVFARTTPFGRRNISLSSFEMSVAAAAFMAHLAAPALFP